MYFPEHCTDARETAEYCSDLPTELPLTQPWSVIPSISVVVAPTEGTHPLCQQETYVTVCALKRLWRGGRQPAKQSPCPLHATSRSGSKSVGVNSQSPASSAPGPRDRAEIP